ncbi:MAG: DNA gyrase modulator, partial [Burkholderiaceae bacterium]
MKIVDPGINALATAKSVLLDPWGLSESDMARALGEIFTHKVDYADLYFQYTRSESWSLEEGIVKTGSFSIEQGVGVRAISGEKTAFAYSDTLSADALLSSARVVRSIGRQGAGRQKVVSGHPPKGHNLYPAIDPVNTLSAPDKVALLERIEAMARAADPHIIQVMAGLGAEYDVVLVAGSDGRLAADVRPLVRLSLTVIA